MFLRVAVLCEMGAMRTTAADMLRGAGVRMGDAGWVLQASYLDEARFLAGDLDM